MRSVVVFFPFEKWLLLVREIDRRRRESLGNPENF